MMKKRHTVFVGMSGGVDSSVAAALLKERGFDVVGIHLRCYNVDGCAEQDAEDARRAAETLGIPFYVLDYEKEYKAKVVEYMIDGYRQGITPNPDVMCNKEIKFGLFLEAALKMGADYVATGHYVRIKHGRRNSALFAARDSNKDQSYFLWTLTQRQLRHCLFPIGDYLKPEVRKLASKYDLPNAEKKDSQGICFLGQVTLGDFLGEYLPKKKGIIVTTEGKIVGEHDGAHHFTIGQRHGLNVSGPKPHYVVEKDVAANAVLVAEGDNHPALFKRKIALHNVNLIHHSAKLLDGARVQARVRYRQPVSEAVCRVEKETVTLTFKSPQKFVAEGQSAVLYSNSGEMLGGGVIVSAG